MGLFHCIPEKCATVRYQEYLAPVIRWRYGFGNWQEIIGDDYSLEMVTPEYEFDAYCDEEEYQCECIRDGRVVISERIWGKLTNFTCSVDDNANVHWTRAVYSISVSNDKGDAKSRTVQNFKYGGGSLSKNVWGIRKLECPEPQSQCVFKVFYLGELVFEEKKAECPEVEQLPCRLDERIKSTRINKLAYLQRLEIRNQSIDVNYVSPLEAPLIYTEPLPPHCLNFYSTLAAEILLNSSAISL